MQKNHTLKWKGGYTGSRRPVGWELDWTKDGATSLRSQYRWLRRHGLARWDARAVLTYTVSATNNAAANRQINLLRARMLDTKVA